MDINLDWNVIAAVTSALVAILGFLFGMGFIKKSDKKDPVSIAIAENERDHAGFCGVIENSKKEHKDFYDSIKILQMELIKLNTKVDRLIKDCDNYITQQQMDLLVSDFSKNLLSVEKRLEQMLSIVVTIKDR